MHDGLSKYTFRETPISYLNFKRVKLKLNLFIIVFRNAFGDLLSLKYYVRGEKVGIPY